MSKIKKTFTIANFYIRADFRETFDEFLELIEKDPALKELQYRKHSLFSVAISQLIIAYVNKNEHRLKINQVPKEPKDIQSNDSSY